MTKACIFALTIYILTEARYSDNLQFSFKTKKEMQEIREDIIQAYKKYSINLKFLRSTVQYDDTGSLYESKEERSLGLKLNFEEDTIVPDVHLNLYGKHQGAYQGPNMEDE